jgi:hypothetical protein
VPKRDKMRPQPSLVRHGLEMVLRLMESEGRQWPAIVDGKWAGSWVRRRSGKTPYLSFGWCPRKCINST